MSNSSPSTASPCPHLPDDILANIFKRISIVDRVRMKLVCKNWKRVISQDFVLIAPEVPWLILSNDSYSEPESNFLNGEIRFETLLDRAIYCFKLPDHLQRQDRTENLGCWFCGSSRGWVLVAVGPKSDVELFLWNPLSGSTRKLPFLTSLPFYDVEIIETSFTTQDICRMEVFQIESWLSWVVAVIFNQKLGDQGNHLAVCTSEDEAWTLFGTNRKNHEIGEGREFEFEYIDLSFHTKEKKLHVLVFHTSSQEGLYNFRENSKKRIHVVKGSCEIQVNQIINHRPDDGLLDFVAEGFFPNGFVNLSDAKIAAYIVESSEAGGVVIARALMDCLLVSKLFINANDEEPSVPTRIWCDQTVQWTVCLPQSSDNAYTQELKTIGDEALFVGGTTSFCIQEASALGLETDCIYFATDHAKGCEERVRQGSVRWLHYVCRERGAFSLQHHRMTKNCCTKLRPDVWSKVDWFTPKIFMS